MLLHGSIILTRQGFVTNNPTNPLPVVSEQLPDGTQLLHLTEMGTARNQYTVQRGMLWPEGLPDYALKPETLWSRLKGAEVRFLILHPSPEVPESDSD